MSASASRRAEWPTRSKRSTAAFSPVEGPAHPQAHRRERIREPPARTASGAPGFGRRRPISRPRRTRQQRLAVLRASRAPRSAVRAAPLRPGRQPADGQGRVAVGPEAAARHPPHPPRACGRLRRDRRRVRARPPHLDPPQRRPLSARPLSVCRPRLRAPDTPADRNLGRGARVPRAGRPRPGEAHDDPVRPRRAALGAVEPDAVRGRSSRGGAARPRRRPPDRAEGSRHAAACVRARPRAAAARTPGDPRERAARGRDPRARRAARPR